VDVTTNKVERWTTSETAVHTDAFADAELIRWKSFDGKTISGFLYRPPAKFTGKRPVLIDIHGGPEGQSRPSFLGRRNYYLNELGIALILPNVRGSTGYGKTFTKLDNGFLREDSYKDINALFDWIAGRPDIDAGRIAGDGRQLRRPHDTGDLHILQKSHPLLDRYGGHVEPGDVSRAHGGIPPRPTARGIWR
jgi:dipeptidyl aminopeptidase/acylaminoacyl peptidase